MATEASAVEQDKETNLFNSVPSDYSQGKATLASCCISYLHSSYLTMLQKFLEGCRVYQHCCLQRGSEWDLSFSSCKASLWLNDWLKRRSLGSAHFLAIWGWE